MTLSALFFVLGIFLIYKLYKFRMFYKLTSNETEQAELAKVE